MKLIDIHAHLETSRFEKDIDEVIERAIKKNMIVINSGVNPSTNRKCLELKKKYPETIKISFGLYPVDALLNEIKLGEANFLSTRELEIFDIDSELKWIEKNQKECIAIGEIGLDYHFEEIMQNPEAKEKQKEIFRKILKLANKISKPVVIHSRKAEEDAIGILEEDGWKNKKVIMHCFSAKKSLIKRCAENGWYLSVPPIIARLQHFQTLVEIVPVTQLLTETDSPYLSPIVGERNEPANVEVTIEEIAKIKQIGKEEVAEIIWDNAHKLGFV